jgi:hypothetical protein
MNILMRLLAVSKLSLEASRLKACPATTARIGESNNLARQVNICEGNGEYDFIVLGHGNAGKSAIETLKDQCPGATIALVDPIRSLESSDVNLQSYRQPSLGFHPPSRTVKMSRPNNPIEIQACYSCGNRFTRCSTAFATL